MRRAAAACLCLLALGACSRPSAPEERGRAALAAYGCGSCHRIPGVAWARGRVGPPLVDLARRGYVAGRLPTAPAAMVRFIRFPQQVDPGNAMPDLAVSESDARDMVRYLYGLRQ